MYSHSVHDAICAQDVTGIGTVLRFPAGVLVTIPEDRAGQLSAYTGSDAAPRVELITGALTNTKVRADSRALSLQVTPVFLCRSLRAAPRGEAHCWTTNQHEGACCIMSNDPPVSSFTFSRLLATPLVKLRSPEFPRAQRVHTEISTLQVRDVTRCVCVAAGVHAAAPG